ncbi:hypothetical protein J7J18_03820 [bacterium]|nr:hypothetical protein [bacterium]
MSYPEDKERWSESLAQPEGGWASCYVPVEIYLDAAHRISGDYCIGLKGYPSEGYMGFCLVFNEPMDFSMYKTLNFYLYLYPFADSEEAFTGVCRCWLTTADPYVEYDEIEKIFTCAVGSWEKKSLNLYEFTDAWGNPLTEEQIREKLSHVYGIAIALEPINCDKEHRAYLDRIYLEAPYGIVSISSVPSGKGFYYNGIYYTTPKTFREVAGAEITIVAEDETFLQWEDGSRDRTRTIVVPEGSVYLTAYYEGSTPPTPPQPTPVIIGGLDMKLIALLGLSLVTIPFLAFGGEK